VPGILATIALFIEPSRGNERLRFSFKDYQQPNKKKIKGKCRVAPDRKERFYCKIKEEVD
jgi:hypothetical protein